MTLMQTGLLQQSRTQRQVQLFLLCGCIVDGAHSCLLACVVAGMQEAAAGHML